MDVIQLDNGTGLFENVGVEGGLAPGAFESGAGLTAAATSDGRIIYDITSGALYYDADGVGGAAAIQFTTIASDVDGLSAEDFLVV
jgi:Ca2+-binding RTX toxin-like protein